jgi:transcriptional regulator GlxA family with amidase domain
MDPNPKQSPSPHLTSDDASVHPGPDPGPAPAANPAADPCADPCAEPSANPSPGPSADSSPGPSANPSPDPTPPRPGPAAGASSGDLQQPSRQRRRVGILIFDDVEVLDFAGPFEVFSRTRLTPGAAARRSEASAPFEVFTVAPAHRPVTAVGGLVVVPRYSFADAPAIDLLVVPGGIGTRPLLADPDVIGWIRHAAGRAERVTSVCTGALLLAEAGLLEGRRATTHWAALDELAGLGRGVEVVADRRVVDDGVVTSAGVSAGMDMAFHLVEALCGREVADETAHYIEYRRNS